MLHANELNLRAVFKSCDGGTTGPRSFAGPLGQVAAGAVEQRLVTAFAPVAGSVPELTEDVREQLSNDQRLMYDLAVAVQRGAAPEE